MLGHVRWLLGQLPELVEEGILDDTTAERLGAHYRARQGRGARERARLVVTWVGALLCGLGVALILAHNWSELAREIRAGLAFLLILSSQAMVFVHWWRGKKRALIGESVAIFAVAALGAGVALISQAYHVRTDVPGFLLVWTIASLPVSLITRARSAAAGSFVLATVWFLSTPGDPFDHFRFPIYLVLLAAHAPFLLLARSEGQEGWRDHLLAFIACGAWMLAMVRVLPSSDDISILVAAAMIALPLSGSLLAPRLLGQGSVRVVETLGAIAFGVVLLIASFPDFWDHFRSTALVDVYQGDASIQLGYALLAAFVLVPLLPAIERIRERQWRPALWAALPVAFVLAALVSEGSLGGAPVAMSLLANLIGGGLGLWLLIDGARSGRFSLANGGLALLGAFVMARFFDADWSFIARGMVFLALGGGLIATNLLVARQRKEA